MVRIWKLSSACRGLALGPRLLMLVMALGSIASPAPAADDAGAPAADERLALAFGQLPAL